MEEEIPFEIAVVVPKKSGGYETAADEDDCVQVLVIQLTRAGLVVDRVVGMQYEFIKVHTHTHTLFSFFLSYNFFPFFILYCC